MSGTFATDTGDLRDVATQVNAQAIVMGGHPLTLAPSLYGSGASLVSDAGATAEDQFRVQRLLIQAELEDLNQALLTAATTLELWDSLTPDDSGEG